MIDAALWGLVQGLTEFLPISSSGHLVLVPAALNKDAPDLATTAVLHIGTLAAVLAYYRHDVLRLLRARSDAGSRRIVILLIVGTIPAAVLGLLFEGALEDLFESPSRVGIALVITGLVLLVSGSIVRRIGSIETATIPDSLLVGVAQAGALVPGISRSGVTITAGLGRGLSDVEAARFSFLLAIPAIAGGGFLQLLDLADAGGLRAELLVGVLVAAISGYLAIAGLIRVITRAGLRPFALYCFVVGAVAIIWL